MRTKYTLAALAAMTLAANAATTAVNVNAANNFGNGYFGFAVNLSSSVVTVTPSVPTNFDIASIELTGRPASGTYSSMKIAVYTYVGDSDIGDFVGLSDAQTLGNATSATFNFSGVSVVSANTYQYLFVNAATVNADLDDDALASYQARSVSSSLSMSPNGSVPAGSGTYKNNAINSWEGSFLPEFTFTAVPEPSSAALLGLGGLR